MEDRQEESEIVEIIDGQKFVKISEGQLFPNYNLYNPREFDLALVSAQIVPQEKTNYIVKIKHKDTIDTYEVYRLQK